MINKNFLNIILGIITGSFIIFFTIWSRFIRNRLPVEILKEPYSFSFYIYVFLSITYFLVIVVTTIAWVVNVSANHNKILNQKYIKAVIFWLFEYIINSPILIWKLIYNNFPSKWPLGQLFENVAFKVTNVINCNKRRKLLILCAYVIPKLIVSLIFLFDIILVHKFETFYKYLILLALPLFLNTILYILFDFCQLTKKYLEDTWLDIQNLEDNNVYIEAKDSTMSEEALNDVILLWDRIGCVRDSLKLTKDMLASFAMKFNLIIYFIYFLGWSYCWIFCLINIPI